MTEDTPSSATTGEPDSAGVSLNERQASISVPIAAPLSSVSQVASTIDPVVAHRFRHCLAQQQLHPLMPLVLQCRTQGAQS